MNPAQMSDQRDAPKPPGIIDTLGDAFSLLNQRPYLILLPVIIDLFLWLGVGVSAKPLTDAVGRWLQSIPSIDPTVVKRITAAGNGYDIFSLVGISVPTLLNSLGRGAVAVLRQRQWLGALSWWAIPPVSAALALVGVGIGMLYLTMVGHLIQGRSLVDRRLWRESLRNAARMVGFVFAAFLGVLLLLLPAILFGAILLLVGVDVVPILAVLGWVAVIWALFLLFFAQYAIVVADAGPLRAIYLSYNVVRRNLWPAAGFVIVYLLITNGVPVALRVLTHSAWSVPLAMIGNAYVATGVVAAAMLFVRDRERLLLDGNAAHPIQPS